MFSAVLVFSMLSLGRILISDLVVTNLLMYSLPGMILLYLAAPFFTPKVFLDEIVLTCVTTQRERHVYIKTHVFETQLLYGINV